MIFSDTFIFIFGALVFGTWLVGSLIEFRKMAKNPEDYQDYSSSFGKKGEQED